MSHRESLKAVGEMLAKEHGITVIEGGQNATCDPEQKRIIVPRLPESYTHDLRALHRCYLDHEVGHIVGKSGGEKRDAPTPVHADMVNVCEDIRVEALMAEQYAGCRTNLSLGGRVVNRKVDEIAANESHPGHEGLMRPHSQFGHTILRRVAGEKDPEWVDPRVIELADEFTDEARAIPETCDSSADVAKLSNRMASAVLRAFPEAYPNPEPGSGSEDQPQDPPKSTADGADEGDNVADGGEDEGEGSGAMDDGEAESEGESAAGDGGEDADADGEGAGGDTDADANAEAEPEPGGASGQGEAESEPQPGESRGDGSDSDGAEADSEGESDDPSAISAGAGGDEGSYPDWEEPDAPDLSSLLEQAMEEAKHELAKSGRHTWVHDPGDYSTELPSFSGDVNRECLQHLLAGVRGGESPSCDDYMQAERDADDLVSDASTAGVESVAREVIAHALDSAGTAARRLSMLFDSERRNRWVGGKRRGRPDPGSIARFATGATSRPMRRRAFDTAHDTAVYLLVDGSGSMFRSDCGMGVIPRCGAAGMAAIVMADVVSRGGHAMKCSTFDTRTNDGDCLPTMMEIPALVNTKAMLGGHLPPGVDLFTEPFNFRHVWDYVEDRRGHTGGVIPSLIRTHVNWGEQWNRGEALRRMGSVMPAIANGCTPMSGSILGAGLDVASRNETRKVLMVMADGDPAVRESTRFAISFVEKLGVEVVLIGMGCRFSGLHENPDREVYVEDLRALGSTALGSLRTALGMSARQRAAG